jgi:biopolymer transport protein ExbD
MGGVSVGGDSGGKKAVDHEIPLIPFIDLLLVTVMFLLVTAVWNQLARINAQQQAPGQPNTQDQPPPDEKVKLFVRVNDGGYVLQSSAGDRVEIPKTSGEFDLEELKAKLEERRKLEPNRRDIIVAPEDGIEYSAIIGAMDAVIGQGYVEMTLQDGAALPN